MKTYFNRSLRTAIYFKPFFVKGLKGVLICALFLSLMPKVTMAQEGNFPLYLPSIRGGLGEESTQDPPLEETPVEEEPIEGFDESTGEQIEVLLMAEATAQLPEPPPPAASPMQEPAALDFDGDGVPNAADNCPRQPNPPVDGSQPELCGRALTPIVNDFVYLQSRTSPHRQGLDPDLKKTQKRERIHVILHVIPNQNGVVLPPQQRANLESLGVNVLGYFPHNAYIVSVPRVLTTLQEIVALENVRGISALHPKDKVATDLRLQGPTQGRNPDGTFSFDVDFFQDVAQSEIEALFTQAGVPFEHQYDHTYRVTLNSWEMLRRLAIQDIIYMIEDLDDEVFEKTLDGQALINGPIVHNALDLRGSGITVSMTEGNVAEPITRTDMIGRVTLGNNPIFQDNDGNHAQMVAGIMVSDGGGFVDREGLLPEAQLVTYSTAGLTLRAQHFGVNEEAHDDFGAIASNNSWGPDNCSKAGKYSKRGKYFDRAVSEVGINIVWASGNTRGPTGTFSDTACLGQLYTLPHPVAKNDISVGNWNINTGALEARSSAGPALDGRLKPDLIAPGQGIDAVSWGDNNNTTIAISGGGTSAAAPVTTGVVGWLAESFLDQGMALDLIMPARYKAILIHTAKDISPSGPDYFNGYGLIRADRALRIAEEWSLWGREGTVDSNVTLFDFPFDVNSAMTFYKATLVWDDEPGDFDPNMALQNDLDLTLVSPSGAVFLPYDLPLPAGAMTDDGSVPCVATPCDILNNVEMVVANPTGRDFIETGTWHAFVNTSRLVSNEQSFSLVLSPPCPLEIDSSVRLRSDVTCTPSVLEPAGVVIQTDGVDLDCDQNAIIGGDPGLLNFDGNYVGVRIAADNVTVRNCAIRQFDVGIKVGTALNPENNATLFHNSLSELGTVAIELEGDNHTADTNLISDVRVGTASGISLRGDLALLQDNQLGFALPGGIPNHTVGILVHPDSVNGTVVSNDISGGWKDGIRLRSVEITRPVQGFFIDGNVFEGVDDSAIELSGEVRTTTVSNNEVLVFGNNSPAINLVADEGTNPQDITVSGNTIVGAVSQKQVGIQVSGAERIDVTGNTLSNVDTGISESQTLDIAISTNNMNLTQPPNNYLSSIGIVSSDSLVQTSIANNTIRFTNVGIVVERPDSAATVSQNMLEVRGAGITVNNASDPVISDNGIRSRTAGISVSSSPGAVVSLNQMNLGSFGVGIGLLASDGAAIAGNTIISPNVGIHVSASSFVSTTANTVRTPATVGIVVSVDNAGFVDSNLIEESTLGIHYQSGNNAVISTNVIPSFFGGTGIRLGTDAAGCPINVDNILVQDNVLSGGLKGVEVLCDVGTHTLINN